MRPEYQLPQEARLEAEERMAEPGGKGQGSQELGWHSELEGPWRPCGPNGSWLRRGNQAREEEFALDSPQPRGWQNWGSRPGFLTAVSK